MSSPSSPIAAGMAEMVGVLSDISLEMLHPAATGSRLLLLERMLNRTLMVVMVSVPYFAPPEAARSPCRHPCRPVGAVCAEGLRQQLLTGRKNGCILLFERRPCLSRIS